MVVTILTLFPEMFSGPFDFSIVKRAKEKGKIDIRFVNIRDFSNDSYKTVDDHPYGGGAGMIMKVDVIDRALTFAKTQTPDATTILLDPRGKTYTQDTAHELSKKQHLIFLCGHYEGIDERIRTLVDREISLGDFVMTGGELPTACIVDSIVRLIPGVLTDLESTVEESFHDGLEYPQYTRPPEYNGQKVPDVLLSGDHKKIHEWKKSQSRIITKKYRPDLVK